MLEVTRRSSADALVPGERDLARGLDAYLKRMDGLPVVAANLIDTASGRTPFPPYRVVEAGGVAVALVGVLGKEVFSGLPRVGVAPPAEAARQALEAARAAGAELVVVLAHMPFIEAEALLERVPGVHLAFAAHDGRPLGRARRPGGAALVATSDRGRHAGQLDVYLGPRPWRLVDAGRVAALRRELAALDTQAVRYREGIEAATSKAMRSYYEHTLAGLEEQRREQEQELQDAQGEPATGTRFRYGLVAMDGAWPDDGATRRLVDATKRRLAAIGAPVSAHEEPGHGPE